MSKWNEREFIAKAKDVAHKFVTKQGALNDLSEKVARDEALSPDEIRTLVRLANVAAFQELFATKQGSDKMIEFDVGDPEVVVRRIIDAVANPPQAANIHNDKLASYQFVPDMMVEKRFGRKFDDVEKVAAFEDFVERTPRKDMAIICARKYVDDFEVELHKQASVYENAINTVTRNLRKAPGYGPDISVFEKTAFSEFGEDARHDLALIYSEARVQRTLPDAEKVAKLVSNYVGEASAEVTALQTALNARKEYTKISSAIESLKLLIPEL